MVCYFCSEPLNTAGRCVSCESKSITSAPGVWSQEYVVAPCHHDAELRALRAVRDAAEEVIQYATPHGETCKEPVCPALHRLAAALRAAKEGK